MQKHGRTIASDMMRLPLAFDIECIEQNQLESFDYVAIKRCEENAEDLISNSIRN